MRVGNEHWEYLINFTENHSEIITNRSEKENGRQTLNAIWVQLVMELHSGIWYRQESLYKNNPKKIFH